MKKYVLFFALGSVMVFLGWVIFGMKRAYIISGPDAPEYFENTSDQAQ